MEEKCLRRKSTEVEITADMFKNEGFNSNIKGWVGE